MLMMFRTRWVQLLTVYDGGNDPEDDDKGGASIRLRPPLE